MKAKFKLFTKQLVVVLLIVSALVIVFDIVKKTKESKSFKDLSFAFQNKKDLPFIEVKTPNAKSVVQEGNLVITGSASGMWFFEGQFRVDLTNHKKQIIETGAVFAQSDWMTTDKVPFEGALAVPKGLKGQGFIVFSRDSGAEDGLPQQFEVPVSFE